MHLQPVYLSAILPNQYRHIPDRYLSPATAAVPTAALPRRRVAGEERG